MEVNNKIYIIGAGPAGCTMSLLLSKNKIHHTIIDKSIFPRDKICGDGLTVEVMKVLKEISPDLLEKFKALDIIEPSNGFMIIDENGKSLDFDLREEDPISAQFYVSKRIDFDNWLFNQIDSEFVTVLEGYELKEIERKKGGAELKIKNKEGEIEIHNTKLLIGCDGERSIVRKLLHPLGITKNREHYVGALRSYYKNVPPIREYNPLEFYMFNKEVKSYFWVFNGPKGISNVGVGALSEDLSNTKLNLKKEFYQFIEEHPALKDRFKNAEQVDGLKGWGIPLNSNRLDLYGDNFIVIGDSASMAEPLTGKGIGVAMYAAMTAIPTIKKALAKDDFSANNLSSFQEMVQRKLYKEWDMLKKQQDLFRTKPVLIKLIFSFFRVPIVKNYISKKHLSSFNRFMRNTTKL